MRPDDEAADQAAGRAIAYRESFGPRPLAFESHLRTQHPKLTAGRVWCRQCGSTQAVKAADAMANGWPKCCGQTMTIDSPEEQRDG